MTREEWEKSIDRLKEESLKPPKCPISDEQLFELMEEVKCRYGKKHI